MNTLSRIPRRSAIRAAQIGVALVLMTILVITVDAGEALRLLAGADLGWLLAAFAALTAQTILSALRWRLTAARLDQRIGIGAAIREYYLSQIVNQSLPGGVLGDAGRAVRARAEAGLVRAGQAVVFERLAGQVVLFAVMILAVVAVTVTPGGIVLPRWVLGLVTLILGGALVLLALIWSGGHLPGAAGRGARGLSQAFARAVLAPSVLPWQAALSLGTTACNLSAFAFCAWATGTPLGIAATVVLVPLILSTMLLPITVSGWGLREGAAAALFPVVGASQAGGLAASVAFGLVYLMSVLPGLLPLLGQAPAPRTEPDRPDARIAAETGLGVPTRYASPSET